MKGRGRWAILAAVTAAIGAVGLAAVLGEGQASSTELKVSSDVLQATADGSSTASFVVYLDDQADVSKAYTIEDEDERGRYVYETLRKHAADTQGAIRAKLDAEGAEYKSYWAVNMIVAEGDRDLVEDLADRQDVAAIESDAGSDGLQEDEGPETIDEGNAVEATEVGVTNVKGPSLWTLGYTGQGIVIANQDTGMRWTARRPPDPLPRLGRQPRHLRPQLQLARLHPCADHECGRRHGVVRPRSPTPAASTSSLPATTTATARTRPARSSVTTPARASARVRTRSASRREPSGSAAATWTPATAGPSTYTECFQFFIAPTDLTGANADPTKRPHVMNNSWGCPRRASSAHAT